MTTSRTGRRSSTVFLEIGRLEATLQPRDERVRHHREFTRPVPAEAVATQASRCLDCGVPYCHGDTGCPVDNRIPDWNALVADGDWAAAADDLHGTNNFPEITGRICPAPCEAACTLDLDDAPVAIKLVEQAVADTAITNGWVVPRPSEHRSGRRVAVVGSGPAGLAAAQQLARAGHEVHVYEREPRPGGLLRYGIPDFKLEKIHVDRRVDQLDAEGVVFRTGVEVDGSEDRPQAAGWGGGRSSVRLDDLRRDHDAVLLAAGAERARTVPMPGVDLDGCHPAMPYLVQQNRRVGGEHRIPETIIDAAGKDVVVIGGGDTASDCIGTAVRQGARSVTQLDIRPLPPVREDKLTTWPFWPTRLRTSSSQAEGADRQFSVGTLGLVDDGCGRVSAVRCVRVDDDRAPVPGTEHDLPAQLVLVAIGFAGPLETTFLAVPAGSGGLARDDRGNVRADTRSYETSLPGVWAAGDVRRGQSLVVWAIREGREAARAIDLHLRAAAR